MELNLQKRLRSHHEVTAGLEKLFPSQSSGKEYLRKILAEKPPARPAAIYLHVPFCTKICGFCNLNRSLINKKLDDYHLLLIEKIRKAAAWPYLRDRSFSSVYFGGGTPTCLSAGQLAQVLSALRDTFNLGPETEISVETSISELTDEKLGVLKDRGVNRLSIGVQSFLDRGRRLMGRRGDAAFALRRMAEIINSGFGNTGIDIIYNYPGQTMEELDAELEAAFSLDLAGASVYALILMKGSALDERIRGHSLPALAGLEGEKAFFLKILGAFRDKGFTVLEPTKFVRPGRDNYTYARIQNSWEDVLAIGTGAGGRIGDYVYYNAPVPMPPWEFPVSRMGRVASPKQILLEKISGRHQFGQFAAEDAGEHKALYADILERLEEKALLVRGAGGGFGCTDAGLFHANTLSRHIIQELARVMAPEGELPADGAFSAPRRRFIPRVVIAALGLVFTGLGFAGIALPLLPATPFFLAALFCFARGSRRFHGWLMSKPFIARPIHDYRRQGGLSARRKLRILALVFVTLLVSAIIINKPHVWIILGAVFALKLFLFLFVVKTVRE
jgi:oxygen-independent coproporphyrinogen-3 oxidase